METLDKGFDIGQVEKTLHREKVEYLVTRKRFCGVHGWFMATSEYPVSRLRWLLN